MNNLPDWTEVEPMETGSVIVIDAPLLTRWNRFLFWLIKRPIPTSKQKFIVAAQNTFKPTNDNV